MLIREKELESQRRFIVVSYKNVDDICNVMRKLGSKNANETSIRGQQVSVIAQESLTLAVFILHHWWQCTFDWEVMGVCEETIHLLSGQKRLKDKFKDLDMLPKVNKASMVGMMESVEEYLRSHHGVIRVSLAYIIQMITVQIYGYYPTYP